MTDKKNLENTCIDALDDTDASAILAEYKKYHTDKEEWVMSAQEADEGKSRMLEEEHPKVTLTFHKIAGKYESLYILMGWENVLSEEDLPRVYINYGPHFWAAGDRIYISNNRPIYQGQVFKKVELDKLIDHLRQACRQLHILKLRLSQSKEIVVELVPLPEPIYQKDPGRNEEEAPKNNRIYGIYKAGLEDAHRDDAKLALILCIVTGIICFFFGTALRGGV